jgi:hypothetical protein
MFLSVYTWFSSIKRKRTMKSVPSCNSDWVWCVANDVMITLLYAIGIMLLFNLSLPDLFSGVRKMTMLHSLATILLFRLLALVQRHSNGAPDECCPPAAQLGAPFGTELEVAKSECKRGAVREPESEPTEEPQCFEDTETNGDCGEEDGAVVEVDRDGDSSTANGCA